MRGKIQSILKAIQYRTEVRASVAILALIGAGWGMWVSYNETRRNILERTHSLRLQHLKGETITLIDNTTRDLLEYSFEKTEEHKIKYDSNLNIVEKNLLEIKSLADDDYKSFVTTFDTTSRKYNLYSQNILNFSDGTDSLHVQKLKLSKELTKISDEYKKILYQINTPKNAEIQIMGICHRLIGNNEGMKNSLILYFSLNDSTYLRNCRKCFSNIEEASKELELFLGSRNYISIIKNASKGLRAEEQKAVDAFKVGDKWKAKKLIEGKHYATKKLLFEGGVESIKKFYINISEERSSEQFKAISIRVITGGVLLLLVLMLTITIFRLRDKVLNQNILLGKKNKDLEAFSYSISHDLKAPLRVISGMASILEKRENSALSVKGIEDLQMIKDEAAKMDALIQGVLAYSRASAKLSLSEKFDSREVISTIADTYKQSEDITFIVPEKMPSLVLPKAPVEQIFRNLITNAIKHCDKDEVLIIIEVTTSGQYAFFTFSDNGPGIPKEQRERVFNFFETGSNKKTGDTGIGLAIVKKLTEDLGGEVFLDSSYVRGCRFVVKLPRS